MSNQEKKPSQDHPDPTPDSKLKTPDSPEGPQGVDKAPGEDPAGPPGSDNKNALKGKKVDGDPSQEKDRPAENTK